MYRSDSFLSLLLSGGSPVGYNCSRERRRSRPRRAAALHTGPSGE